MLATAHAQLIWQKMLRRAQEERYLSSVAAQRVESLMDHGLHLEQVLLGTGLMTRDQYQSLYREIMGAEWEAYQRKQVADSVQVRWSAVRRAREMLRHFGQASTGTMHTVGGEEDPALRSALVMRLARWAQQQGYRVQSYPTMNGTILHLERSSEEDHPRVWMDALQRFFEQPIGILVIRRPDTSMEEWIDRHVASVESTGAWREQVPLAIHLSHPQAHELLEHASLLERPTIVLEEGRKMDWNTFVSEGVPVQVIESHPSPHGRAWSAYPLSYVSTRSLN